jgi:serine/threonine-protein kinase HipA
MAIELTVCPGTLKPGYSTYSPRCIKDVFTGKTVSHILAFVARDENRESYPVKLEKRKLKITEKDGQYILRTTPSGTMNAHDLPANMHVTMQIAAQVFGMPTAKCALIFLEDGSLAYISRRFNLDKAGNAFPAEDFAHLAGLTPDNAGYHYKYNYSYLGIADLIDKYFPAAIPAKEQFFRQVVFNYLFANGNGHMESFSRIDPLNNGDWKLAPAYDLLNTALHGDDGELALLDGLYPKDFGKQSYRALGYYGYDDLFQFGLKMGLVNFRIKRFMDQLLGSGQQVRDMIDRSFLSGTGKEEYWNIYQNRHKRLSTSYSGLNLSTRED